MDTEGAKLAYCPVCHKEGEGRDFKNSTAVIHEWHDFVPGRGQKPKDAEPQIWDACFVGKTGTDYTGNVTIIREGIAYPL